MLRRVLGVGLPVVGLIAVIAMMVIASSGASMPVIDTRGVVGNAQRDTLYIAVLVMLIIVIPVFFLVAFISWRYRDTAKRKAAYKPEWANNTWLEIIWWGVPVIIIAILSVITWQTSHSLDPYRPLVSQKEPVQVQVVSLQWKWLFIYPDEGIATVGEMAMPLNTPVEFTITSDAPMNSFWIPQLGGQIYAMSGMSTKLHLDANEAGDYRGVSANLSGEGHADMTFTAKARGESEYRAWLAKVKESDKVLDNAAYEKLRLPSRVSDVHHYTLATPDLYESIVERYSGSHMMGGSQNAHEGHH
jgi:cytochrome o ubiquinol oxidase subunit 2